MRIVFFLGSLRRGGAERVVSILANNYASKGHKVDICLLLDMNIGYEIDEKVSIIDLNSKNKNKLLQALDWMRSIRSYIKTTKPDRIVSFIGRINIIVLMACKGLKCYTVVSERNDPKHDGRGPLTLKLCDLLYKNANAVVFQTEYEASCFSNELKNISHIIPNPVSVNCLATRENKYRIVSAGRLLPQKNQALLISAIAKLHEIIPEVKLDIYGDGVLKGSLENMIMELKASDYVSLKGNVKNLHEEIRSAAVFVLTSRYEGLSNALIEAMMMGLPCVGTNYPGADELIDSGINGILVPLDSIDDLVDILYKLLNDDDLSSQLSRDAMRRSKDFSAADVCKKWENVIGIK